MLKKYTESICSCKKCVTMCQTRPCWPTPQESKKLIENGFLNKLMLDWWVGNNENIFVVSPAIKGYESKDAPYLPTGVCTFLENNLCKLHDLKLKPSEGRMSGCNKNVSSLHKDIAMLWDSDEGKEVVKLWKF